ncbi:MAG: phenylalanine--tRNA ligase subunit beta [Mariprofundaceae bacterium]
MKIPFSWLKEHTPLTSSAETIADDLVRLGHEVEGVELPRAAVNGVRVGLIQEMKAHPDADKLKLLKIDIGEDELLGIVCGASNMGEGDKVPVATIGTLLPNGLKIKKGKIRGQVSFGMCCSEVELGLAEESAGLLILPADAPVGAQVGEYLELEEAVFDLSITPNRGDCMSVRGLARDLAAAADLSFSEPATSTIAVDGSISKPVISMSSEQDCPVYLARRIQGVKVGTSPSWMQQYLIAAGQRPVNGVVDVLNYIMLDLGQPMHAFDADQLQGDVNIRAASEGEGFSALDGRELKLAAGDLVVTDENSVIALAGIMGSEPTGVTEATSNIMLESAFFRPARVSTTRRIYAMVSEASMRFERGVDPLMIEISMQRATAMIIDLFGGSAGEISTFGDVNAINAGKVINFDIKRIESRLGVEVPVATDDVLSRMGFAVSRNGLNVEVGVPSHRHDVSIPEDMSEEYARVIGFEKIPEILPVLATTVPVKQDRAIHDAVATGFVQAISYAFISADEQRLFTPSTDGDIELANPISEAMSMMRRSVWPGLLNAAKHNLNLQQTGVALVEQGRLYVKNENGHSEDNVISWLMTGEIQSDEWFDSARKADFFDLKGAVESWLAARGLVARFMADDDIEGLQAGQSAKLLVGRTEVGRIGKVDADIADLFDIEWPVFVAEINLDVLPTGKVSKFVPLLEFPGVERDLVFLFDRGVQADDIIQAARKAGGKLLTGVRIFDLYQGQGVADDKVSLGIRFALQATDRTLTQEESDSVSESILSAIDKKFGASLRG